MAEILKDLGLGQDDDELSSNDSSEDEGQLGRFDSGRAAGDGDAAGPEGGPAVTAASIQAELKTQAQGDLALSKYVRMKGFGVPVGGIKERMVMDGVDEGKIGLFVRGMAESPGAADALGYPIEVPSQSGGGGGEGGSEIRSSVPLVKLHWTTVPDDKLRRSVWSSQR